MKLKKFQWANHQQDEEDQEEVWKGGLPWKADEETVILEVTEAATVDAAGRIL